MPKRSLAQLLSLTDQVIKTNNNEEINAVKDNSLRKTFIDSFLNLVDGGLVIENEAGYLGAYRPTSPGAFATVDMIPSVSGFISLTDLSGTNGINYDNLTGEFSLDTTKVPYFTGGISGIPDNTTYLRGDGVWATVSGGVASVSGTTNRITSTGGSNPVIDISASYVGQSSITTLGTIGTGVWQGSVIEDAYISSAVTWNDKQDKSVVVSSNQTAINDGFYNNVANSTYTDPSPVEGKGFVVFVRNGTATIGGTGYSTSGMMIRRIYHSGAWSNYVFNSGIISPTYGGTGVNNGSSTITIGGNVAFTGAFNATIAVPRTTIWTLPNTASETLAGLGTAQTFSAQNTFSSSSGTNIYSVNLRNVGNTAYLASLSYNTGDKLLIGSGSSAIQAAKNIELADGASYRLAVENSSSNTVRFGSGFQSSILLGTVSAQVVWASYSMNFSGSSVTIVGATPTLMNSGAGNSFTIRTAAVGAGSTPSGNLGLGTGDLTSATAPSGNVCIDPGAKGSGGTKGNVQFFLTYTTATANSMEGGMVIGNRTTSPTTNYSGGTYLYANNNNLETTGSFYFPLIGTGTGVKVGTNGRLFTATLTAGTVTVSNSSVTVNTRPIITLNTGGSSGTLGLKYNWVCTAGQIVITSLTAAGVTEVLDTSTVQVYLIEGL